MKNKDLTSEREIEQCIKLGEHVKKGRFISLRFNVLIVRDRGFVLFEAVSDVEEEV
jgi:hypothetical protein